MPAYEAASFHPPAPVAFVAVRSCNSNAEALNIPMILDTGADVSLLPRAAVAHLLDTADAPATYQLEAFDGTRSHATVAELELRLLNKSFRGQFLLVEGDRGILGRNILNSLTLLFDGPALAWCEQR